MAVDRLSRVNELLHREIGLALFRCLTDPGVNMASIMVSHVITSRNLRKARVLVSIRGNAQEQEKQLSIIRKHRHELQQHINKVMTLKYTPVLEFELDNSVSQGDHVLQVLEELHIPENDEPATDDPETAT